MTHIEQKLTNAFNAFEKGQFKQAEILFLECLDKIEKQNTPEFKQALHGLAIVKSEQEKFKEASEIYYQLLSLAQVGKNKQDEAIALHQLGMVQRMNLKFKEALHLFKSEQEIYETHNGDFNIGLAANFYEQAMIHIQENDWQRAHNLMEESLHFAIAANDLNVIAYAYRLLGDITLKLTNIKQALDCYEHARTAFLKVGDPMASKEIEDKVEMIQQDK